MHFREFCVFLHFAKLLPCFACCLRTGYDEKTFLLCLLRIKFWYRKKKQPPVLRKFNDCEVVFWPQFIPHLQPEHTETTEIKVSNRMRFLAERVRNNRKCLQSRAFLSFGNKMSQVRILSLGPKSEIRWWKSADFQFCTIHSSLFNIHHSLKRISVMNNE